MTQHKLTQGYNAIRVAIAFPQGISEGPGTQNPIGGTHGGCGGAAAGGAAAPTAAGAAPGGNTPAPAPGTGGAAVVGSWVPGGLQN